MIGDFRGLVRYTARTLRNCQYLCLLDPDCSMFVYFEDESLCISTTTALGEAWPTRAPGHSLYVVLTRYHACPGYRCDSFQCLNKTEARCDGVTDCDDLSDEAGCSGDYGFKLRLAGGSATEGRLEARIRGSWGAVCDDLFDIDSAHIACRELGFLRARRYYLNGRRFPDGGALEYALNGALCAGNETSLSQCTLLQTPGRCVAGETVALECTDEPSLCSSTVSSFQCPDGSGCVTQQYMCRSVDSTVPTNALSNRRLLHDGPNNLLGLWTVVNVCGLQLAGQRPEYAIVGTSEVTNKMIRTVWGLFNNTLKSCMNHDSFDGHTMHGFTPR